MRRKIKCVHALCLGEGVVDAAKNKVCTRTLSRRRSGRRGQRQSAPTLFRQRVVDAAKDKLCARSSFRGTSIRRGQRQTEHTQLVWRNKYSTRPKTSVYTHFVSPSEVLLGTLIVGLLRFEIGQRCRRICVAPCSQSQAPRELRFTSVMEHAGRCIAGSRSPLLRSGAGGHGCLFWGGER